MTWPGQAVQPMRDKLKIHAAALAGVIGASFGLHASLQAEQPVLAAACFGLLLLSLLVTLWLS